MRDVYYSGAFKKGYKSLKKQPFYDQNFDDELWEVIDKLANDIPLEEKYKDHWLNGKKVPTRECHIAPNWLLVYTKDKEGLTLTLLRTGPHNKALK